LYYINGSYVIFNFTFCGTFAIMWTPATPGLYKIVATFEGSGAYYSSYAETALGVVTAPAIITPIPTQTATTQPTVAPTTTPTVSASPTVAPTPGTGISTETLLIAGAAVIIIIAIIAAALVLRKRK
jgi:hypothetical protein